MTFVISFLLRFCPGIGPFVPIIEAVLKAAGKSEAQICLPIIKDLVHQAEADKTMTGPQKFEWVLERALKACVAAQPAVALSTIRFLIESEVQTLKLEA